MNTMVQEMSWDMATQQEGSEITALSSKDIKEVNGAFVEYIAFGAGLAIGIGISYLTRNRS